MDVILRNALVVDGSNAPARRADVGVAGGRIAAVGDLRGESAGETVDLDGLVLAPGFIDVHTHYDAQMLWDPALSPSPWHGVTTVVMGNCGLGVAPLRAEHGELVRRLLGDVEGMPPATVDVAGRAFASLRDYWKTVGEGRVRINAGMLLGHSALRVHVMGEAALDGHATPDDVQRMQAIVRNAIDDGALGLSTSRSPGHESPAGRPIPSRQAAVEELVSLVDVLGDCGRGVFQITPGPDFYLEEMAAVSQRTRRPVSWAAILTGVTDFGTRRVGRGEALQTLERMAALGGELWPQVSCRPLVASFTLREPFSPRRLQPFKEVLAAPMQDRLQFYRDPAWRARAEQAMRERWQEQLSSIVVHSAQPGAAPRPLRDIATQRGVSLATALFDAGVEESLQTRFEVRLANDDEEELATLLNDDRCVLGLSDAGAHVDQLCDAVFPTHLLGRWVRDKQALTLERAVWHLSGQPARVFRIAGRGLLREGYAADLVAFDPQTVADLPLQWRDDLPDGGRRLVGGSRGIEHVWVNGVPIRRDGRDLDATPGQMATATP